ncbi:hypothetical protein Ae168Ps1_5772 [Pseudonocardia sp. Ae168_Ps1]|nr:hypothetical protein Ae168Ps1_5772 [Pseudonocardia sp. Ae168_Ps1]OLL77179.1 hypothetical protein Ae150APs1_5557c [Pseudonocardia sp. Ae150A_Ps1]OLL88713.1 hypothetical protein Ae263Ps1_5768 [Pseudonocardia sp. Ae263_Ps1]OLL91267.1 hypothetical protein Ae356Ps1_1164c [Pseudonocardia sp. Ae356_Ps1]
MVEPEHALHVALPGPLPCVRSRLATHGRTV